MKMEIPVIAEKAGTVASILVAEGDGIIEGQSVVTLET
jgi:biotin carboxyl carrier protein